MMTGYGMAGGFGWIFMVLWSLLIAVGIFALVKWIGNLSRGGRGDRTDAGGTALRILEERYARGEIDDETFQKSRRNLTESHRRE